MLQSLNGKFRNVNPTYPVGTGPVVTGYAIALGKASAPERAFTGARLVLGWTILTEPRVTQAARLVRASVRYIEAAREILLAHDPKLEAAVCNGDISLLEAAVLAKHPHPTLAQKFMTASAAERADLAKAAGVATLWDELIVPSL
jgi:hypothetical protein